MQVPIFQYNYWWLVILYGCFMLLVGAYEAVSRPAYTYTVRPLAMPRQSACHLQPAIFAVSQLSLQSF